MAASAPDPHPLQAFQAALVTHHSLTQRAYLGTLRDFLAWLATQPGGDPFRFDALTQTAVPDYLVTLKSRGAAPRTRSRAIAALRRSGPWAVYSLNADHMKNLSGALLRREYNAAQNAIRLILRNRLNPGHSNSLPFCCHCTPADQTLPSPARRRPFIDDFANAW